ncbi:response regulator transcription factor [Enterococcus faecalis]|uniref:response regulator transcription factor n=1 Tax=Enterococcus faecalis TaxID=1351 RepID=UPI001572F739|nr:response regulator transcription factor [Enterococcus faecalis]HEL9058997.1 response regulator transcription factor [Listeria monocytogenes]EHB5054274.1 response regulator transcription factor [Enterococcus faecalis]EHF1810585.1 response regulator transcription factor [Enterococcus faecalis]EJX8809618.1 response regulator transcription factor [Enterococcus faecalis]EJX8811948.1 response regulator transcription factor [Enterococcus faecalis]
MDKILIIDDNHELCHLIRNSLQNENYVVTISHLGLEGCLRVKNNNFTLIILDIMLPDIDGFQVLERIRSISNLPVLMLTASDNRASKVQGLITGADDYLTKPFDMEELVARVYSLIRRYTLFNEIQHTQKMSFEGLLIDTESRIVTVGENSFELPRKEFDILSYCAKNQGKVLTKKNIYEHVWEEEYVYDDSNIMAIISRLRKKIESDLKNPKYIQTVSGIGYRFNKDV